MAATTDRGASSGPDSDGPSPGAEAHAPAGPAGAAPRRRTALVTAVVLGVVVALLVVVLATRDPNTERVTQSPLIGRLAPDIEGTTLSGEHFDLSGQRGRWVVVNFFATWCTPCLQEHPQLVAFEAAHAATGDASVVSVLFDDQPAKAREVFAERGGSWPVVIDEEGAVGVAYGVARVPESFLVAPDGTVVRRLVGGVTAAGLDSILAQLDSAAGAEG